MYKKIEKCRICGNTRLQCVLDLGQQMLTGVFPRAKNANITTGPLRLVKCVAGNEVCGLLQLQHSYDLREMYGENYGYRSGLNASMVAHLHNKVKRILVQVHLNKGDLVVDIGGAATLNNALRAVRMGGAVALVGLIGGPKVEIDVTHVFSRLIRIRGIGVGSRADLLALLRAIETRRIRPVIDREFSFNEVSAAFRHFKAGAHFGKVVIRAT